jgi:tRNA dimethylallyltransferase
MNQNFGFVIVGPTASGKTLLAHTLFEQLKQRGLDPTILNYDSRQMIQGFDIGTSKPTSIEQKKFNYQLIDVYSPQARINSKALNQNLRFILNQISTPKIPIIMVGSPFYWFCFLNPENEPAKTCPPHFKMFLKEMISKEKKSIWNWLKAQGKTMTFHYGDEYRFQRYLEKWFEAALPKKTTSPNLFQFFTISPKFDLTELKNKIETRVRDFFQQGWSEEVQHLSQISNDEIDPKNPGWRSIGYLEIYDYQKQKKDWDDALIQSISQKTWRYAKKQINWLKKFEDQVVLHPTKDDVTTYLEDIL